MIYKRIRVDGRKVDEHRSIVEKIIGRKLLRYELVHHINGNKRDNRILNLEIVTPAIHAVRHKLIKHPKTKKCVVCGENYTPNPTKRKSSKTCSQKCRYDLLSLLFRSPDAKYSMYRADASPSRVAKIRNITGRDLL